MSVACGGKCGRPGCPYVGKDQNSLFAHIGGVKATREGKVFRPKSTTTPSASMTGGSAPRLSGPETPFYAPLRDLPAGFGKPEDKAAPGKAAPPPSGPLFDSTPWWLAFGELL